MLILIRLIDGRDCCHWEQCVHWTLPLVVVQRSREETSSEVSCVVYWRSMLLGDMDSM